MVNGYCAAEDGERLRDFHDAAGYCVNGTSGGRALVNAGVKFAGGLAVVQAFYSEGGEDTAGNGSGEGIFPVFYVGDGVAKFGERLRCLRAWNAGLRFAEPGRRFAWGIWSGEL